ncbi:hypothetical protein D6783_02620 [Candidatus Woesearchaeota archaeon]|nr:MAG: hypothetical protein D6783_02620 [Candidatus Woesearchaeota archaeon]
MTKNEGVENPAGVYVFTTSCGRREVTVPEQVLHVLGRGVPTLEWLVTHERRVAHDRGSLREIMSQLHKRYLDHTAFPVRGSRLLSKEGSVVLDIDARENAFSIFKFLHYAMSRKQDIYISYCSDVHR